MKKLIVAIVMIFAVAFLVAACQKKEEESPRFKYPAGTGQTGPMQALDEIKLLQETVKKDPGNVRAWIKLGNDLMDGARYDDAIDAYRKALALDPKDVDVRVDMGTCYRRTGKPEIAAREFRKAIEIDPSHVTAHKNLAVVLAFDMKDNKGAIKQFEKVLALAPNAADAGRIKMEIERLKAEGQK
ncbi:MAG: tetratricopeptide repeat protein [Candidatus Sulfobium sp.]|jgi:cytochrome c-type biogenesis protein CcmH/NrfG